MIWFALFLLLIAATFSYGSLSAAPWVPMHKRDVQRIVQLLSNLPAGSTVYELGCGDARVAAALANAGYEVTGFEISILPFFLAFIRRLRSPRKFSLNYKSFWSVDFSKADAIVMFLMPAANKKLHKKFAAELPIGTHVVSYVWPIPDWTPTVVDQQPGSPDIFLYVTSR